MYNENVKKAVSFAALALLFFAGALAVDFITISPETPAPTAELAALPAGADSFVSGFVTPASCGVEECDKFGCTSTDYGHPEYGGACQPPYSQAYYYSQGSYAPPSPTINITGGDGSGSSTTINEGDTATIEWECVGSGSSSGVNFSTGGEPEGSAEVSPSETTEYTVICSNGGEGSGTVNVIDPDASISASPSQVRINETTTIEWSASDVDSCAVSEDNPDFTDSWTGTSGSETTSAITGETTYTLTCENDSGEVSESVNVTLIPVFQEF